KRETRCERKISSPHNNLLFRPSGPSKRAVRMMRGRSRGGRAETPVSTLLVLVAILTVLAPIAEATMSPPGPRAAPIALLPTRGVGADPFDTSGAGISSGPSGLFFDYVVTIVMENHAICALLTSCGGAPPDWTRLAT